MNPETWANVRLARIRRFRVLGGTVVVDGRAFPDPNRSIEKLVCASHPCSSHDAPQGGSGERRPELYGWPVAVLHTSDITVWCIPNQASLISERISESYQGEAQDSAP